MRGERIGNCYYKGLLLGKIQILGEKFEDLAGSCWPKISFYVPARSERGLGPGAMVY